MAHGAADPGAGAGGLTSRRVGAAVAAVAAGAFAVVTVLLVPWTPVPGGMPSPAVPEEHFSAAQIALAESYAGTARLLGWAGLLVSLAVSALLGLTPLGGRLLGRRRLPWPLAVVGLVAAVLLVGAVAQLPLGLALRRHRLEHGLTRQPVGDWLVDQVLGWLVASMLTSLALLVLVACARRWRVWWPAVAAPVAAGFVLAGSFLHPVVIEPVFNDFTPMAEGPLRTRILELAAAEGVAVDDVLVADASRRTTTLNAYVSGYGETRRVVVYDTLLEGLPAEQTLSVVAHELAHARHDDVLVGTTLGALGAAVGVGLLGVVLGSGPVRRRAGVTGAADPRAVALVLALVAFGSLAAAPLQSGISRRIEARADVEALEASDPDAFIALQRQLALRSLADPTPPAWAHWWFGTHPLTLERIALAESTKRRVGED